VQHYALAWSWTGLRGRLLGITAATCDVAAWYQKQPKRGHADAIKLGSPEKRELSQVQVSGHQPSFRA